MTTIDRPRISPEPCTIGIQMTGDELDQPWDELVAPITDILPLLDTERFTSPGRVYNILDTNEDRIVYNHLRDAVRTLDNNLSSKRPNLNTAIERDSTLTPMIDSGEADIHGAIMLIVDTNTSLGTHDDISVSRFLTNNYDNKFFSPSKVEDGIWKISPGPPSPDTNTVFKMVHNITGSLVGIEPEDVTIICESLAMR